MPATERSFQDVLPSDLFLDVDFLIAVMVQTEPHHNRSASFFERLTLEDRTTLYVSSLTWMEFGSVITKERFRLTLPAEVRQRFNLSRWQQRSVRRNYLESFFQALQDLLDQFSWTEVSLTPEVRTEAAENMMRFNLRPHDAVVCASATQAGISDLASYDESFRRVDLLTLWNDHIHQGKPVRG